jgi:hypothetical protein
MVNIYISGSALFKTIHYLCIYLSENPAGNFIVGFYMLITQKASFNEEYLILLLLLTVDYLFFIILLILVLKSTII